jgi:prepilin-type N-terminal cleavage/methylation domain-containing protein
MLVKKNKGFTLIELLVVIAIIGLLSTIAVIAMSTARSKARDTTRVADARQMSTALEQYFSDNSSYPGVIATGVALGSGSGKTECTGSTVACTCISSTGINATCAAPTYMASIPTYPGTVAGDCTGSYGTPGANTGQFCYYSDVTGAASANYKIVFHMENTTYGGSTCTYSNGSGLICV